MTDIADLKERIPIEELFTYLGGQMPARQSTWSEWLPVQCVFHPDSTASASLNRQLGRFRCHGCDIGGDIIDLAKEELGVADTRMAIEWLERTFG